MQANFQHDTVQIEYLTQSFEQSFHSSIEIEWAFNIFQRLNLIVRETYPINIPEDTLMTHSEEADIIIMFIYSDIFLSEKENAASSDYCNIPNIKYNTDIDTSIKYTSVYESIIITIIPTQYGGV